MNDLKYYWEHLGLLGIKNYERQWFNYKLPTYKKHGLYDNLLTTDEKRGINSEKIDSLIEDIINNNLKECSEPYSKFHYSIG